MAVDYQKAFSVYVSPSKPPKLATYEIIFMRGRAWKRWDEHTKEVHICEDAKSPPKKKEREMPRPEIFA